MLRITLMASMVPWRNFSKHRRNWSNREILVMHYGLDPRDSH